MKQNLFKPFVCSCTLLALSACGNLTFSNKTVHQGNLSVISNTKQLHTGMSKQTVAKIMGTSLVQPMFSKNRWDYTLTTQKPNQEVIIKSAVLYFKENTLIKIINKG